MLGQSVDTADAVDKAITEGIFRLQIFLNFLLFLLLVV